MERQLRASGHPAAIAWRRLAGSSMSPDRISTFERRWKRKTARPVYRLRSENPTFDVIAKPCKPDEANRTTVIYRDLLQHLPIRYPRLLGDVKDEKDDRVWLFLELVEGTEYRPSMAEHRRLAGTWLATLHTTSSHCGSSAALAGFDYLYDIESRSIAEHLDTADALLPEVADNPALGSKDRLVLQSLALQCMALRQHWSALTAFSHATPRTLVHGDFCVSNILVQPRDDAGALVVFDWQRSGWASPAFDLTRFLGSWADPDIEAYLTVARRSWPGLDAATIRRLAYVGEILRWIEALRWEVDRLRYDWIDEPMGRLRVYERWMNDIQVAAPWHANDALENGVWHSVVPYERPRRLPQGAPVHA